jgi:hypothetical protein
MHIGQNYVIATNTLVGIFDLDNTTRSQITLDFLKRAEESGDLVNVAEGVPRAFIVTGKKGFEKVYLAHLAAAALHDRSGAIL